jgi:ketosteroid isomerase-like protein
MFRTYLRALNALVHTHAVTSGGGAQDCSGTITVEEAMKAEDARFAAQMNNDFAAMEKLYGDDLVYIHSSTVQDTKATFIESMRSGAVKYRSMKRGAVKVRTYGCIAIVTGESAFEVTARGQELTLNLLYHAVWAKRAAGVQFVSWQATRIMPK